jgi:hypothetical protein
MSEELALLAPRGATMNRFPPVVTKPPPVTARRSDSLSSLEVPIQIWEYHTVMNRSPSVHLANWAKLFITFD